MSNRVVVSLAILKVNWDKLGRDYIENFVPLAAECVRSLSADIVTLEDLRREMREAFGINLPHSALRSILTRLRSKGFVSLEQGIYVKAPSRLAQLEFGALRDEVLANHETLIGSLSIFCRERFGVALTPEEAEAALQAFLSDEPSLMSAFSLDESMVQKYKGGTKREKFYVASFIETVRDARGNEMTYLDRIIKGNMLANAVFLPNPAQANRRFNATDVYFDTSFLLYALGYAGDARKAARLELMDLLYVSGANLRCFAHTADEASGALRAIGYLIAERKFREVYGPSGEFFLSNSYSSSDVLMLASRLKQDLEGLRIRVVEQPAAQSEFMMDEQLLAEKLGARISYRSQEALWRDVSSISSIVRLRRRRRSVYLEECGALLVTSNVDVARVVAEFFSQEDRGMISPCMTDYALMNVLWLKQPTRAPELPWKRVIADCYAATHPDEKLWELYIREIERLELLGKVTAEDYFLLRHSMEARSVLMALTHGEESAFVEGTVAEILSRVKESIREELEVNLEKEKKEKEGHRAEVGQLAEKAEEMRQQLAKQEDALHERNQKALATQQRIRLRSERAAATVIKIIKPLAVVVLLVGSAATFPWGSRPFESAKLRFLLALLQVLVAVLSFLGLIGGTALNTYLRRWETFLAGSIERRLRSWFIED